MASVNKVILIGRLGADPETRAFPNGGQVCNIRLATTDKWRDKASGEAREHTEWHAVVFSDRLAEIAGQYLRKGAQVYVEGSLRTRKWQGSDGADRYTTEVRGTQLQMLGGKRDGDTSAPPAAQPASRPATRAAQPAPQSVRAPGTGTPGQGSGFDDMGDDIPF